MQAAGQLVLSELPPVQFDGDIAEAFVDIPVKLTPIFHSKLTPLT